MERRLHTLVEAIDLLERSPYAEQGEEVEKVVFPKWGGIFNQSGYKFTVRAFVAQKLTKEVGEEKETSVVELRGEDEPEVEMIPDIEVRKHEKLQCQP